MSLTVMVISACVNDTVHHICYYLKAAWLWFIMWLSHHHLLLVVISVFQRYKTDFSTSIGWYINIISVNEITVKVKTVKPNMLLPYFYSRIPATTAAVFYRKFYGIYFYSVAGNSL